MKTFKQADRQVWQALVRMRGPEMAPLLSFFNILLEDTKDALLDTEGAVNARLQGRGCLLREITEAVKEADAVLKRLK